jgi:membrane protein DedA with SNARE-associated domain
MNYILCMAIGAIIGYIFGHRAGLKRAPKVEAIKRTMRGF